MTGWNDASDYPRGGRVLPPEWSVGSKKLAEFSFRYLKAAHAESPDGEINGARSPLGIHRVLALSRLAAKGATRDELNRVLGFPDNDDEIVRNLRRLHEGIKSDGQAEGVNVSIADSLWCDTNREFKEDFLEKAEGCVPGAMNRVDMDDASSAAGKVNDWVSKATHDAIPEIVSPADISRRRHDNQIGNISIIAVSALYYKADWGQKFDKSETQKEKFRMTGDRESRPEMMHRNGHGLYAEDDLFQMAAIPCKGGAFTIWILLPKEVKDTTWILANATPERFENLARKSDTCKVDMKLPKFGLRGERSCIPALKSLGLTKPFEDNADFSGMFTPDPLGVTNMPICDVTQKGLVEVNEDGAKAVFVTRSMHMSIGCSAPPMEFEPPPVNFHADHPFLFVAVHNKTNSVLYAGWVGDPAKIKASAE